MYIILHQGLSYMSNVKKWLAALVACGHLTNQSTCPCCVMKKATTLKVFNQKKKKSKIEKESGEEK